MAFLDEFSCYGEKVVVVPQDEYGPLDLASWLPAEGSTVYCCGPEPLLEAVGRWCRNRQAGALRTERFVAERRDPVDDRSFEVSFARSGGSVTVPPGVSVLDAVRQAGIGVLSSCAQGLCGTCETAVLEGVPEHRDSILDDSERQRGDCMFVCVSRSRTRRLVLDL